MTSNLFTGQLVRLAAIDAEREAELFARWDRDSEYVRLLNTNPRPLITAKKIKESIDKEMEEHADELLFSIHTLADDRPIGFIVLDPPAWSHGDAFVAIGIGDRACWGSGYGTDAMRVLLRYAFQELNLYRISLNVFEYNERALKSYLKAGFVVEGRQRGALLRNGRRWDLINMGVLREEWLALNHDQSEICHAQYPRTR